MAKPFISAGFRKVFLAPLTICITTLSVGPVPLTLEPPETSVPDYTMTIVYAAIAIIIAVVIAIAILGIMLLKKRA